MQAAFEKSVDLFYLKCAVLFMIHEKKPSKLTILPKKEQLCDVALFNIIISNEWLSKMQWGHGQQKINIVSDLMLILHNMKDSTYI